MIRENIAPKGCPYHIEVFVSDEIEENTYLIYDPETKDAVVIDPGYSADKLNEVLKQDNLKLRAIIATHAHVDHILQQSQLHKLTGAPVWLPKEDEGFVFNNMLNASMFFNLPYEPHQPEHLFKDGDVIEAGSLSFETLHVPGHTPGLSLIIDKKNKVVFSGDLVFAGSIGRTDLPGAIPKKMQASLEKFMELPEDYVVYPGHGPDTTVGRERRSNPFLTSSDW